MREGGGGNPPPDFPNGADAQGKFLIAQAHAEQLVALIHGTVIDHDQDSSQSSDASAMAGCFASSLRGNATTLRADVVATRFSGSVLGTARLSTGGATLSPMRNWPTRRASSCASPERPWLAAVASSTIAAFCCVTWSIWFTAVFTSPSPVACSLAEAASSTTNPFSWLTWVTMRPNAWPVSLTSFTPVATCAP